MITIVYLIGVVGCLWLVMVQIKELRKNGAKSMPSFWVRLVLILVFIGSATFLAFLAADHTLKFK